MNEQVILDHIGVILNKMHQNKQLQSLAKEKGLPVKGLELNDDTEKQLSISVVALMLAKMEGDGRYKRLSDMGMQKRSLKVEIINDYKDRANMLLNKYKNQSEEEPTQDDDFSEAYKIDDVDDIEFIADNI